MFGRKKEGPHGFSWAYQMSRSEFRAKCKCGWGIDTTSKEEAFSAAEIHATFAEIQTDLGMPPLTPNLPSKRRGHPSTWGGQR